MVNNLYSLQVYQKEHDEKYHADICALPHPERIRHLVLHFAKYCGRLADTNLVNLESALTDAFIIGLSMGNVLSINLDMEIEKRKSLFRSHGILSDFAFFTGGMAKACEALDHMENQNYKEILTANIIGIFLAINFASKSNGLNTRAMIVERWKEIEKKGIL